MSFWVSGLVLLLELLTAAEAVRSVTVLGWAGASVALLNVMDLLKVYVDVRSLQAKPFEAGELIEPGLNP